MVLEGHVEWSCSDERGPGSATHETRRQVFRVVWVEKKGGMEV